MDKLKILRPSGDKDGVIFRLSKSIELPRGMEISLSLDEVFDLVDNLRTAYETHIRMVYADKGDGIPLRAYIERAKEKEDG